MSIQITNPVDGSQVNIVAGGLFSVCGTIDVNDPVDATLTDEQTGDVYLPNNNAFQPSKEGAAQPGDGSYGAWSLTFNIEDNIAQDDYLFMYAYDTVTGDSDQKTYQQEPGGTSGCDPASCPPARAADKIEIARKTATPAYSTDFKINVDSIPTAGVQNIHVTVTHPQKTSGFVFLILRKKRDPQPLARIVESHRLSTVDKTHYTFQGIAMDDWDFVSVNAVVKGSKQAVKPVVLKPPKK